MDNNYHEDKNKLNKVVNNNYKLLAFILSFIVLLTLLFAGTYFVTDKILSAGNSNNSIEDNGDKPVYNNTKALSNDVKILLMNEEVVEKQLNIGEFKKENDLAVDVSEAFIINYYQNNGYELDTVDSEKVVFKKKNESVVLEPNKYYVGEKDGFFAIFKSDSKGKLTLEKKEEFPTSILNNHPKDLEEIKNFKYGFDTLEEAEMQISQYTS